MVCRGCGKATAREVRRDHRYVESGLSNVTIRGARFEVCSECKKEVLSLPWMAALHRLIGFRLLHKSWQLSAEEIRFLRKYLNLPEAVAGTDATAAPEGVASLEIIVTFQNGWRCTA